MHIRELKTGAVRTINSVREARVNLARVWGVEVEEVKTRPCLEERGFVRHLAIFREGKVTDVIVVLW